MLKTPQNWIDSSVPSAPRVYLKTLKPRLREVTPIVKAPHSAPVLILSRFTLCGRTIHSIQCSTVSQIVCSPIQPSSHRNKPWISERWLASSCQGHTASLRCVSDYFHCVSIAFALLFCLMRSRYSWNSVDLNGGLDGFGLRTQVVPTGPVFVTDTWRRQPCNYVMPSISLDGKAVFCISTVGIVAVLYWGNALAPEADVTTNTNWYPAWVRSV